MKKIERKKEIVKEIKEERKREREKERKKKKERKKDRKKETKKERKGGSEEGRKKQRTVLRCPPCALLEVQKPPRGPGVLRRFFFILSKSRLICRLYFFLGMNFYMIS